MPKRGRAQKEKEYNDHLRIKPNYNSSLTQCIPKLVHRKVVMNSNNGSINFWIFVKFQTENHIKAMAGKLMDRSHMKEQHILSN